MRAFDSLDKGQVGVLVSKCLKTSVRDKKVSECLMILVREKYYFSVRNRFVKRLKVVV